MSEKALKFVDDHRELILDKLKELIRIPSCSWDNYDPSYCEDSAKKTAELLIDAGFEHVELIRIDSAHPYVYADYLHAGSNKPTVLLYAHHDVQPPMREELWVSSPYDPQIRNQRLYGRGSADDKAGIIMHMASLMAFLKCGETVPINIKVIIEGEEEIGSPHLHQFLKLTKEKLKADLLILADLSNFDTGVPALTSSLRGLVSMELEIRSMANPLHSGMFGGPIPDPAVAMAKIIAGLIDDQGNIAIPELYPQILELSESEKRALEQLPISDEDFKTQVKMEKNAEIIGGKGHVMEKIWRRPAFSVNSMESGSKALAGNVIMDIAWAKIGLRLAPGMDADFVQKKLIEKIKELCPWGLQVNIQEDSCNSGWTTATDHPYFQLAKKALGEAYGREALIIGCGGSIPFVGPLSEALGSVPALLVGVEDPYCNAHSENESVDIGDFFKAIKAQIILLSELAKIQ